MDDLLDQLEGLHYEELIHLNREIVARIKALRAMKAQHELQQFKVGNQVQFMSSEGELIVTRV
jgi:hypothetical protein